MVELPTTTKLTHLKMTWTPTTIRSPPSPLRRVEVAKYMDYKLDGVYPPTCTTCVGSQWYTDR